MLSALDSGDSSSSLKEQLGRVIAEVESLEERSENTNSATVQEAIKRNVVILENLTRAVSSLGILSGNEDIKEIEPDSVRFLLLPALLGFLTGKITSEPRLEVLQREQVYYNDFLNRLRSYSVIKPEIADAADGGSDIQPIAPPRQGILAQSRSRQQKIERYKEQQSLQEKLAALRQRANNGDAVDDPTARELYITELKLWAGKATDAIETAQQELQLLLASSTRESGPTTSTDKVTGPRSAVTKPFIITKTELQKAMYGLGYPSIPTVSLEEFFEQKRREGQIQVIEGSEPGKKGPTTEEEERIDREQRQEGEDPDLLRKDRDHDEYRDDHRRGWGSVHNKG